MGTFPPKLDAPGAGLPLLQSLLLRYYVGPYVAARADWNQSAETFERLHGKMLKIALDTPSDLRTKRVLVSPLRGLEDSSRHWSMVMVLEHLLTVGEGIKVIFERLARGHAPGLTLSTAAVKPSGHESAEAILRRFEIFSATCMRDLAMLTEKPNLEVTQVHPWFGPFNARQWHWLLGAHAGIHYQQIKKIKEGLPAADS